MPPTRPATEARRPSIPQADPINSLLSADSRRLSYFMRFMGQYLYFQITAQAQHEFYKVLTEECWIWQTKARTDRFLETHSRGLVATLYQNGTFAHTTGEVSYHYEAYPLEY